MSKFEPILLRVTEAEEESDLYPIFGSGRPMLDQAPSDEVMLAPLWDSLGEVGVSDKGPAQPAAPSTNLLGDFGFHGTFLSEGVVLPGSLEVKDSKVTLWAGGAQLASWKSPDCRVERTEDNLFSVEAEGEMITFTADDPEGLSKAIDVYLLPSAISEPRAKGRESPTTTRPSARPRAATKAKPVGKSDEPHTSIAPEGVGTGSPPSPEQSSGSATQMPRVGRRPRIKAFEAGLPQREIQQVNIEVVARESSEAQSPRPQEVVDPTAPRERETIADRITATATRRFKSATARRWLKSDLEAVAIKAGVVVAAIGIVSLFAATVFILAGGFQEVPIAVREPTTTIPPSPTTTVVATTFPPAPTTLFETRAGELTDRWNTLAEQIRPELTLRADLTSPFVLSLAPHITFEGLLDPVLGSAVIRATPTGTPEGDGLILTSLGLLIGVADPTLDGSDRRALLESLGLAIQDPQLAGLDGTINYNGLTYHLAYALDQNVIQFTITPEGVAIPTTTTTP